MIGKTLGHYETIPQPGKSGRGNVFQANQKLGRAVTFKVFAEDADRVARCQREAKLSVVLNDPTVADAPLIVSWNQDQRERHGVS